MVTSAAAGVVVGAVPIPFSDAVLLTPTEIAEVNAVARIYEIGKDEQSKQFLNSIVEVGTVGAASKALISGLKAIPGVNLGSSIINAVIAGVIIAALGEGSTYAFEQVYLGNKSVADIDWVKKIIESKLSLTIIEKAKPILLRLTDASDRRAILAAALELRHLSSATAGTSRRTRKNDRQHRPALNKTETHRSLQGSQFDPCGLRHFLQKRY